MNRIRDSGEVVRAKKDTVMKASCFSIVWEIYGTCFLGQIVPHKMKMAIATLPGSYSDGSFFFLFNKLGGPIDMKVVLTVPSS